MNISGIKISRLLVLIFSILLSNQEFKCEVIVLDQTKCKITMVTSQHKQYSSQFLRQVNECSKTQDNFSHFWLRPEVRSNIINLGIRKYHQPYRRIRAGKHLFHRIHMVVTQFRNNRPNRLVNTNNLASLKWCIVSEKVNTISGALLNC